jgi:hypothetical protein
LDIHAASPHLCENQIPPAHRLEQHPTTHPPMFHKQQPSHSHLAGNFSQSPSPTATDQEAKRNSNQTSPQLPHNSTITSTPRQSQKQPPTQKRNPKTQPSRPTQARGGGGKHRTDKNPPTRKHHKRNGKPRATNHRREINPEDGHPRHKKYGGVCPLRRKIHVTGSDQPSAGHRKNMGGIKFRRMEQPNLLP